MPGRRLAGLRLTLNLIILAASLLFSIGAIWAVAAGAPANDPMRARLYAPVVRLWMAYAGLSLCGQLLVWLAAAAMLVMLLFVFLYTFRWRAEEWTVIAVSGPVYLLLVVIMVLGLNLFISMIKWIFALSPGCLIMSCSR